MGYLLQFIYLLKVVTIFLSRNSKSDFNCSLDSKCLRERDIGSFKALLQGDVSVLDPRTSIKCYSINRMSLRRKSKITGFARVDSLVNIPSGASVHQCAAAADGSTMRCGVVRLARLTLLLARIRGALKVVVTDAQVARLKC